MVETAVNRIFCIGKNYASHVAEMAPRGYPPDGQCVIFMKPNSAIVAAGQPLHLPRDRGDVHHEAELVVRLGGFAETTGPVVAAAAARFVTDVTLGIDLTLRSVQADLKTRGAPWEASKSFDGSAPLGSWTKWESTRDLQQLEFTLSVNGTQRQRGLAKDMLFPVDRIIEILSQSWRLADGDIIYTGTPAGVGSLEPGDVVSLEGSGLGPFEWHCV